LKKGRRLKQIGNRAGFTKRGALGTFRFLPQKFDHFASVSAENQGFSKVKKA